MNRLHSTIRIGLPVALGLAAATLLLAVLSPARVQAGGTVGTGTPGSCSEQALLDALDGGGLVTFNCGPNPHTITLTERIVILEDTTIDGGSKITLDGRGQNGILFITSTASVNLYNLEFRNGNSSDNGNGGAILNAGTLVVSNSTFISNTAPGFGDGGAIFNTGRLTVTVGAFYSNTADYGGAIGSEPSASQAPFVYIGDSVFQGNQAFGSGGAVSVQPYGHLQIGGSQFFNNRADFDGGAIHAYGTLTLTHSAVYSNTALDNDGGGIYAQEGPAYLYNVDVYSNVAGNEGGGMYTWENVVLVEHARFYNNAADTSLTAISDYSYGGGLLLNEAWVTLRQVEIYGNRADTSGGGLYSDAYLTADDVDIHHNTVLGPDGWGGGADLDSSGADPMTLNNVRVWANTVISGHPSYAGGGLSLYYSPITITNSAIYSNTVIEGSGGGGIHASYTATVAIINTAIYSNVTFDGRGGGIEASDASDAGGRGAVVTLINTTLSGNYAPEAGALVNDPANAPLVMTNTTVVSNTSGAGGVLTGSITLKNSLVAFNLPANCGAGVSSAGHNLESADTCGLNATGDVTGTNPLIGPLAYNGGVNPANLTHALLEGSPAIDTADDAACPGDDQRGEPRPLDGNQDETAACDKGAFEFKYVAPLYELFMAFLRRGE